MHSGALAHQRIVVTRTRSQASELSAQLAALGAVPIEVPLIDIAAPSDEGAALAAAVGQLGSYQWVALSSPNGAHHLATAVPAPVAGLRVAAVGPATAAALETAGWSVDLVARRHIAEGLVEDFPAGDGSVLIPQAEIARPTLADGLRGKGWSVDVVTAYRTVAAEVGEHSRAAISEADVITFTSSSTVTNFCAVVGVDSLPPIVACIGPITAETARRHGITPDVIAHPHTINGLVDALVSHFG